MNDTGRIAVSITPDGRTMERSEVVEYLKILSQHILAKAKLENELDNLHAELAEATKEEPGKQVLPPEPDPPLKESYPLFTLIAVPFFMIAMMFADFSPAEKLGILAIGSGAFAFSLIRHRNENRKARKDWEERRAAWEKDTERIRNLNSVVSVQDPPEVAGLKERLGGTEDAYEKICDSLAEQENRNILAPQYRKDMIPCILYSFFLNGRANTLAEAINLFHEEMYRQNQEQNQLQFQQEMRMHQDALMLQQNLNAARLSQQIEDAKNEIELQSLMDSLYTVDMINLLMKSMR